MKNDFRDKLSNSKIDIITYVFNDDIDFSLK